MAKLAIVYHSGYGHTAVVAEHVARGARAAGVEATLYKAEALSNPDVGPWNELAEADGIIFGAPTYMGSLSAAFKQFMEASSKSFAAGAWRDKIAAGFTNSGSLSGDKLNALQQLAVFASQHSMIWVSTGLAGGDSRKGETEVNRVGSWLGLMAQSHVDQGPDVAPPAGDRQSAEVFGRRVAGATQRWAASKQLEAA